MEALDDRHAFAVYLLNASSLSISIVLATMDSSTQPVLGTPLALDSM